MNFGKHLRPSAEKTLSRWGLSTSMSTDCLRLTVWIGSFSIIQLFKNQRMKYRRQGISKFWSRPGTCRRQKLVYPKSEVAKKALSKSPSIDSTSSKVPKISQIPQSICVFVWFFSHDPPLKMAPSSVQLSRPARGGRCKGPKEAACSQAGGWFEFKCCSNPPLIHISFRG